MKSRESQDDQELKYWHSLTSYLQGWFPLIYLYPTPTPNSYPHSNHNHYTYPKSNLHPYLNPQPKPKPKPNRNPNCNPNPKLNPNPNTNPKPKFNPNPSFNPNPNPYRYSFVSEIEREILRRAIPVSPTACECYDYFGMICVLQCINVVQV